MPLWREAPFQVKITKHTRSGPLLEVEMPKKCTPLWRKAHFELKMYTAHQVRTTFGSWDLEKVHAVVARSTFRSQNVQNTSFSDHFWKVEMTKKCTPLWREAHFQLKMYKAHQLRTTFGSWDDKKVHAVVARSKFRSQYVQSTTCWRHFWTFRCRFAWQAQGIVHLLSKVSKTWGFCSISRNDGRRWTFEEDLQRCMSRGRRSTKDMFMRDVRRSGRWFPERGCILEHQICRFAKMMLRDRCSTSYDLESIFRGRCSTLDRWSGTNRKTHWYEAVSAALNFRFLKEVSQNCFVIIDVVKFKNRRSLAELLRFGCC